MPIPTWYLGVMSRPCTITTMPTVEGLARRYWRLKRLDDPLSTNRIEILLNIAELHRPLIEITTTCFDHIRRCRSFHEFVAVTIADSNASGMNPQGPGSP
ncbi:MAG: hypothetical protein Ct9H300mP8_11140 [Gammaproteobacteria bacterium]|nr:MAG: hypothetical protein Ct9H300mP8_11140 [Gammaproteobacteria bacterium]